GQIAVKTAMFDGAGVGFQRDFAIVGKAQTLACAIQKTGNVIRRKQAGRTTTEEYADDGAIGDDGTEIDQVAIEIGEQGIDVVRVGRFAAQAVRVEVAVRTFF